MITLDTFGAVTLTIAIVSIVMNIIQFQKQLQMKKETLKPIYNGLIGLFNDL
jgi:flagellar biosynthesis protein FlhB